MTDPIRLAAQVPWPEVAANAPEFVLDALVSGRWAISSTNNGAGLYERRFADAFARYLDVPYCVPTDHGSSALVIAMETLDIEAGAEVVVPALTWVATATAVFRAGLVPVLADVDPATGCVTPATIEEAVGPRTAAVVVVHWACVMADMPAILDLAERHGLVVIEDAAQAHGAGWNGKRAGTFGAFGCFSMQHAKVLTCGEGGAVVTGNPGAARRLEELRADSRSYRSVPVPGSLDLCETASIMGANFGLGELSAALLCAQLELLPEQHRRRNANYELFARCIDGSGARLLRCDPHQDTMSIYEVPILLPSSSWSNRRIAAHLSARLGIHVYVPREPLARSALLRPDTKSTLRPLAEYFVERHKGRNYPSAESITATSVVLHHSVFLGESTDIHLIADEVSKVAATIR